MLNVVLKTQNLTKKFKDVTAVDNLNLQVNSCEIFGFLGPNGAGKTTTINMIAGLLKPDKGQVFIQGKPINDMGKDFHARVGVCPQEIVLWERLTCIEQLQFIGQMYGVPGKLARKRGEELLNELDLLEKKKKLAKTLSGGMKRRLNLAMALVHDPDILILDEPEAGLDPQSRVKVREYIKSLAQSKTIIITTHNMDEADRMADRVAIIDHGKLLVLDTPDNLKANVGKGDVIEIGVGNLKGSADQELIKKISGLIHGNIIEFKKHYLTIRSLDAVRILPKILDELENYGIHPMEVKIRENSLEDVFIKLTGRSLRE